ncbi:probable aldehyde dehydrogenase [Tanacetum coccineum]
MMNQATRDGIKELRNPKILPKSGTPYAVARLGFLRSSNLTANPDGVPIIQMASHVESRRRVRVSRRRLKSLVDYVSWVCDQDAYACSGQKCSAQSMLFMHENWSKTSLLRQLTDLAARRKLEDLTVGPVLTVTTEAMLDHMKKLLQIPGSKLLFGGEELENHHIPSIYGAIKPTASSTTYLRQ